MLDERDTNAKDLAAYMSSDAKALRIILEDMHDSAPPYRLHAAIVLTEHLSKLSEVLMELAEGKREA